MHLIQHRKQENATAAKEALPCSFDKTKITVKKKVADWSTALGGE
jgi:hypothetical protein